MEPELQGCAESGSPAGGRLTVRTARIRAPRRHRRAPRGQWATRAAGVGAGTSAARRAIVGLLRVLGVPYRAPAAHRRDPLQILRGGGGRPRPPPPGSSPGEDGGGLLALAS